MRRSYLLAVLLMLLSTSISSAQTIHTFAGGGPGTGTPALSANLNQPIRVVIDASGNYYFSAYNQHRVFKVDGTGTLTVVAGTGIQGFSGDGGPATSANLSLPVGLTFDSSGNLYIADYGNHRIRKVNTSGTISTVAGNGGAGFTGDNVLATSTALYYPSAVAFDASGNFYIADEYNHRLRKVNTAGIISTIAGTGAGGYNGDGITATSAQLYYPFDVLVDASGNVLIADEANFRVRKVNLAGTITTVAGNGFYSSSGDGGLATSASLQAPYGIGLDASGNLYIADYEGQRIRKVNTSGIISRVAGTGTGSYNGSGLTATSTFLNGPSGVAVDATGQAYIADRLNNRVRKINLSAKLVDVAGNGSATWGGDGGPATNASLYRPQGVKTDAAGNVYISELENERIRKVDAGGNISTVAGNGAGGFGGDGGPATSAVLNFPYDVAPDGAGNLYIADRSNHRIRKVNTSGTISTVAGTGSQGFSGDGGPATSAAIAFPTGVAVDAGGNIYFSDYSNQRIRKVDSHGVILTIAGTGTAGFSGDGGPATSANLNSPYGVTVDANGNLYFADNGNRRVRKVDVQGKISTVAGNGTTCFGPCGDGGPATSAGLYWPAGVAVDTSGNVYISDQNNQRIRKVNTSGIISSVAGNGNFGFSGDGGPATSAMLAYPGGVAVDGSGNIFIADLNNFRIRKVDGVAPAPALTLSTNSLSFGHSQVGSQTVSQSVTVTNSGTASLHVSSVSASGDFLETDDCTAGPIAPTGHCTVNASFLPTATGNRNGSLSITDDATGSPQSVSLTGVGDPAATSVAINAPSVTFGANGAVTVNVTSAAGTVTGNVSLTVDGGAPVVQALAGGSSLFTVTSPTAGDHSLSASYAAQGNYAAGSNTGTLHVDKAGQTITFGALSGKTYGDADFAVSATANSNLAVSFAALGNCTVTVSKVHITGAGSCTITASQAGDSNYNAATDVPQTFGIAKATAAINVTPYSVSYDGNVHTATGTATGVGNVDLSAQLTLSGTTHTTAGTYNGDSWSFAGGTNYNDANGTVNDAIAKATPSITWANPADITYGTALGGTQLNATASVGGTFNYTPASGTALNAGLAQPLSVIFTPTDTTDYNGASKAVAININPAPLTITANSATKILDAANPSFGATYNGFVLGQGPVNLTGTLSCTSTATTTGPVGSYPISCSGQTSSNYAISYAGGTLTVLYALAGGACVGDLGHAILQPINFDGSSVFKQGSTVPDKFRVCDANGVSIGTPGIVASFNLTGIVNGTVVQTVDEAVYSTTPDAYFRWDSTGQQWIFNTSTKNMPKNQTYIFTIGLNDGTTIMFQYGLR